MWFIIPDLLCRKPTVYIYDSHPGGVSNKIYNLWKFLKDVEIMKIVPVQEDVLLV